MFDEARSLGFSWITFRTSTQETGNVFVIEHDNLLAGGPALHYHLAQEEWFYVMEGEIVLQVGDKRLRLGAGSRYLRLAYFRDAAKPGAAPMDAALSRKYEVVVVGPPIKA
jgi:hypothetical protein